MSNAFIPKNIRVGYQNRSDTFTGKLGYVIYYDEKGKIRKEKSWKSWCSESLGSQELENLPKTGYILNRGVRRDQYGWFASGRAMARVYHPDGFEFEITIGNLMKIIEYSDINKQEIVEPCLLAWEGTDLVLIPTNSELYTNSIKYTEQQDEKLSAKSLTIGAYYRRKKSDVDDPETFMYMGYYPFKDELINTKCSKKHVFVDTRGRFSAVGVSTLMSDVRHSVDIDKHRKVLPKFLSSTHTNNIKALHFKEMETPQKYKKVNYGDSYHYPTYLKKISEGIYVGLEPGYLHSQLRSQNRPENTHLKLSCDLYKIGLVDGVLSSVNTYRIDGPERDAALVSFYDSNQSDEYEMTFDHSGRDVNILKNNAKYSYQHTYPMTAKRFSDNVFLKLGSEYNGSYYRHRNGGPVCKTKELEFFIGRDYFENTPMDQIMQDIGFGVMCYETVDGKIIPIEEYAGILSGTRQTG